jgi:hypothetical protein
LIKNIEACSFDKANQQRIRTTNTKIKTFNMKKINIVVLLLIIPVCSVWAQSFAVDLASEVGQWGQPIICDMGNKGNVTVRVKLIKHFGTTCVFDVEFTNNSQRNFEGSAGLKREKDNVIYGVNLARLDIKPNETVVYSNMEKRECKMSLSKKRDQVKLCMQCEPWIGFVIR